MNLKRALLAATILAAPMAASAQPVTGLYIGLGAGANWINNPEKFDVKGNRTGSNFGVPNNVRIDDVGFTAKRMMMGCPVEMPPRIPPA